MDSRLLAFAFALLLCVGLAQPAHAQFVNQAADWAQKYWWRNCASLDMDFVHDQYYINGNTTCDGTVGTSYTAGSGNTGVVNFINGTGATFTRAGTTNVTDTNPPFYLDTSQGEAFVSRASATNNVTQTGSPFYIGTIGNGPSQSFVSRADTSAVATYFNASGVLQTASSGAARSSAYYYNGSSSWVLGGTLIEPTSTNLIRNNTMVGATAYSTTELTIDGSFTSCASGPSCAGWTKTLNGGTGTVTFAVGQATLTGDGTNAAEIYQKIATVSGTSYTFTITTGSGTMTARVGTTSTSGNLMSATTLSANSTYTLRFTATGTSSYIQLLNTSTTAAVVTSVSVQSAGAFPTNWSFSDSGGADLVADVIDTGTEAGINYVDIRVFGTPVASATEAIQFETTTGIPATEFEAMTTSAYIKLDAGSLTNVTFISLVMRPKSSSGADLGIAIGSSNYTPTSALLSQQQQTVSTTTASFNLSTVAYVQPFLKFAVTAGQAVDTTLRIGMPQTEASSYATSVIATSGSTVTRAADIYSQQPASYFDSTGTLYFSAANTARTNYVYSGGSWVGGGTLNSPATTNTLIEPAATNSITNNTMQGAVAADGVERTNNGTFSTSGSNVCSGSVTSGSNTLTCNNGSGTGWVGTINGGAGSVTAASGSMTLTGDGTNAASIYEAIPSTSNYVYTIAVTTGAGNAVTVQAGGCQGCTGYFSATSVSASTTAYFQITATTSSIYLQINNISTTAAIVTTVSLQSAGSPPSGWKFSTNSNIIGQVVGSGTEDGVSYVDMNFYGTTTATSAFYLAQLLPIGSGPAAAIGQTWTTSVFIKTTSGSLPSGVNMYLYTCGTNGSTVLECNNGHGLSSTVTTPLGTNRPSVAYTLSNSSTTNAWSYISLNFSSGATFNFTVRIGMPQLEQTSYATSVIPTYGSAVTRTADVYSEPSGGTYYNSAGVIKMAPANTPRLDYGPGGGNYPLGVLIEEGRTNLVTYSSGTASESGTAGMTYTVSNVMAPDGATDFLQCTEGTSGPGDQACRFSTFTLSASTTYTASAFVKANSVSVFTFLVDDNPNGTGGVQSATVNLTNGTITACDTNLGGSQGIQSLGNGVYRIWMSFTTSSTPTSDYFDFRLSNITNPGCIGASFTGDGVSNMYIWGVQLEQGAFPTSYIPTSGSAVTRAADVFTLPTTAGPGSGWLTQGQGTLAANATAPYLTSSDAINLVDIDDGTGNNAIQTFIALSGYYFEMFTGGAQQYQNDSVGSYTPGTLSQTIQAYQTNSANKAYNDTLVGLSSSVTVPSSLTTLRIGARRGAAAPGGVNGWINRVTYFPIRHPDASLPEFTNY